MFTFLEKKIMRIVRYLFLISFIFSYEKAFALKYNLSIGSVFQNEAPYLKEWIEYHRLQGVEHFWLFNNESTDDWEKVLDPFIKKGIVDVFDWPDLWPDVLFPFGCQAKAFSKAIEEARGKSKWLALIDTDEFLLPLHHESIAKALDKHFSNEVGIFIKWLNFGNSFVEQVKPNELMIERLILCAPNHDHNKFRKSIIKPQYVTGCNNPHYCFYSFKNHREDTFVDHHFRINHYWCRDEWFTNNVKIPRYIKWNSSLEDIMKMLNDFNDQPDYEIQRFVEKLKKKI